MIIYNNKGNPYGLSVEICVRAAGSKIPIQEVTSDGMNHLIVLNILNEKFALFTRS